MPTGDKPKRKLFHVTTEYNGRQNGIEKNYQTLTTEQVYKLITFINNSDKIKSIKLEKLHEKRL